MKKNTELWDRVSVTDPAAVKPITGKPYHGSSPKPYWIIKRATEVFGPIGIGWGVTVKSERFERMGEYDVLHVAVVSVWYVLDGKRSETFDQMGGTKAAYKTSKGALIVDEDAGKKSVTDAMVKCFSMIGFAGDIFSGRWDDSGYVQWASEETRRREESAALMTPKQIETITRLINETGTDFEAFMAWISKGARKKCLSLAETPAEAFEPAKKALESKPKKTTQETA